MPLAPDENPARPEGEGGRRLLERMNTGKHAVLSEWCFEHLDVPADAQCLDIGCGGGANVARLLDRATQGHVWGIDYAPTSVEASREFNAGAIAQGCCEVLAGDVANLPFDDASLDVVTAFETVYFWPDVDAAFAEVRRVLKPGGAFMIGHEDDGSQPGMFEAAKAIEGMTMYTEQDLVSKLVVAGFEKIKHEAHPLTHHLVVVAR